MAESTRFFVGLDVHKDWIAAAVVDSQCPADPHVEEFGYDEKRLRRLLGKVAERGPMLACYEASGGGYTLQRRIASWGWRCDVIAPSLIPQRPGDHRKTDRRDAMQLARYLRAGLLTPVHVPSVARERERSLVRHRHALRGDQRRAQQRVLKFTYSRGHVFRGTKSNWTRAHWRWLRALGLEAEDRDVLDSQLAVIDLLEAQLAQIDGRIKTLSQSKGYRDVVGRLRCLRGVDTYTAMVLVTAIGDVRRFPTAGHLMSYVGLVTSEFSSGGPAKQRRGSITKAGDPLCRHVLVEAAHQFHSRSEGSRAIARRRQGQPAAVVAHARRAEQRLWRRHRRVAQRAGSNVATVAVARELCGFVWALMWNDPSKWLAAR